MGSRPKAPGHRVLTRQSTKYPFTKYWGCACGHILKTAVFGPALNSEFNEHVKKVMGK